MNEMFGIPIENKTTAPLDLSGGLTPSNNNTSQQNSNFGQTTQFGQQPQPVQPMQQPQATQPTQFGQPTQPVQPTQFAQQPQTVQPMQQTQSTGGGVILAKGQRVSLTKMNSALNEVKIGLGWDIVAQGADYDLDAEAFLLGDNDKVVGDDWFIFYNQPISPDGSVRHTGDNRTGVGEGDDESIEVVLSRVSEQVKKIAFVVTINDAIQKGQNFGGVNNAYIRVVDKSTNKELVKFNLNQYYSDVTSLMVGELYKNNGEWKFNPIGDGVKTDLAGLCQRYGVNIGG